MGPQPQWYYDTRIWTVHFLVGFGAAAEPATWVNENSCRSVLAHARLLPCTSGRLNPVSLTRAVLLSHCADQRSACRRIGLTLMLQVLWRVVTDLEETDEDGIEEDSIE